MVLNNKEKINNHFDLILTFANMSEKLLIVKKFDADFNIKSLIVTLVDNGESQEPDVRFSGWCGSNPRRKRKKTDKTSRLVVKLVSGDEQNNFDLDLCAQEINANNNSLINLLSHNKLNKSNIKETSNHQDTFNNIRIRSFSKNTSAQNGIGTSENCKPDMSPLDLSLERVKENNARILENIAMLNRTLNYAKEKEILSVNGRKTSFQCKVCGKYFVYETGLKRHYSIRHSMIESQPRWQIVWTCIECFQVWPRQDLAFQHTRQCCKSDSPDCVREMKTSSLLQCEFCEKVFTCIPRLLKHSKMHKTVNNYECDVCNLGFMSYKAAEQHWYSCPWLKQYKFALPKLLLCNCCDRKFRSYEHLYNHRYKVGHYTTKTHSNQSESIVSFVYQCELCGQWFHSILAFQGHKNQYHPRFEVGPQYQLDQSNNPMPIDIDGNFLHSVEVNDD